MNFNEMANKFLKTRPKDDSGISAKVISFYQSNILLLKNKDGTFELPGGHVKIKETLMDGAKREFEEETGLTVTRLRKITSKHNRVVYIGFLTSPRVRLSKEHIGFKFVPINKLKKYNLSLKARGDLKRFLKYKKKDNDNIQEISSDTDGS